ncbi:MAG: hypothetical protein M1119_07415 [Firmicutes bacterium]|nr:hypothetical protein [Bacillota bacterium]
MMLSERQLRGDVGNLSCGAGFHLLRLSVALYQMPGPLQRCSAIDYY